MQDHDPTAETDFEMPGLTRRGVLRTTGAVVAAGALGIGPGVASAAEFEDLCAAVPNDVMLVLDRSGSMLFEPDKFQNMKDGGTAFVDQLTTADHAGLVSFNETATLDQPLTSDHDLVKTAISGLVAGGSTDIGQAIDLAQAQFPARTDAGDIMVVLSNGSDLFGGAVTAAQAAKDAGTRVITIAYGTDADTATLEEMASDPAEDNAYVAGIDTIEDIFLTISQEICPTEITCDIKPGNPHNPVNPKGKGVIPVAVLTTADFDATTLDPASLRFGSPATVSGGGGAQPAHGSGHVVDVDGDGDLDWLGHFSVEDAGFTGGDTEGWLVGETLSGDPVACSDTVTTVGGGPP